MNLINKLKERKALLGIQVGVLGAVLVQTGFWHGFFQGFCAAALFIWIYSEIDRYQAEKKDKKTINYKECI